MATYSYEIITKTPLSTAEYENDDTRYAAYNANKAGTTALAESTFGPSYSDGDSVTYYKDGFLQTTTLITTPIQTPAASLPSGISAVNTDPLPLTTTPTNIPAVDAPLTPVTPVAITPTPQITTIEATVQDTPPVENNAPTDVNLGTGATDENLVAAFNAGPIPPGDVNLGTGATDENLVAAYGPGAVPPSQTGYSGEAYDDAGNLMPGWTLDEEGNPVYVGGDFVEPATSESAEASRNEAASRQEGQRLNAQQQQTLMSREDTQSSADWRVRISLAEGSTYLYNTPASSGGPGILGPLSATQGVIFPYTPSIETTYQAKYSPTDLMHSNYKGYFYQSSSVGEIQIRGTFTAQDTAEAQYLLAVIHFFRSVTKMFYGKDEQAGVPPPLVFLSGYGQYQFNNHPCVVGNFQYSLPTDVDYIRAEGFNNYGINMQNRNSRSSGPAPSGALATIGRLLSSGLFNGSLNNTPSPSAVTQNVYNTNATNSTYVPTKMDISLTLLPIQTRSQQSQQFSLKGFANGDLLKGGFW